MRHQCLPVECFHLLPVGDQGEAVIRRGHSGFLNISTGDIVDKRRFAGGVVPQEKHPRRSWHILVADRQAESIATRQQREFSGINGSNISLEFYKIIHCWYLGQADRAL